MNRERGGVTLMMVLVLLMFGSLMLQGSSWQLAARSSRLFREQKAWQQTQNAHSALAWGTTIHWLPTSGWQCQQHSAGEWRACLNILESGQVVLAGMGGIAGSQDTIAFWRLGHMEQDIVSYDAQGWLDFCPLKEDECQVP